jgi:hypothetical protein
MVQFNAVNKKTISHPLTYSPHFRLSIESAELTSCRLVGTRSNAGAGCFLCFWVEFSVFRQSKWSSALLPNRGRFLVVVLSTGRLRHPSARNHTASVKRT